MRNYFVQSANVKPYDGQEFIDSPFYMPYSVIMWHWWNPGLRSTGHSLIQLTRVQHHRFNPMIHKWYVLCQSIMQPSRYGDVQPAYHASYYETRAEARAARIKMKANPFMQWDSIAVYSC